MTAANNPARSFLPAKGSAGGGAVSTLMSETGARSFLEGKGFPRPSVSDRSLNNIVRDLYKGEGSASQIGDGSTAYAVRFEKLTGKAVEGVFHSAKLEQYMSAIRNWLMRNPGASAADKAVAETLLEEAAGALAATASVVD